MTKRTTVELDERLLARAKRALGSRTTRATIEEALRRAADEAEGERNERADRQLRYLETLAERGDPAVLASDEMWR
jgi:Arc/MetJ family transcription regulator